MAVDRSWRNSGHYYPLLPRHEVFLLAPSGNGELFARRFVEVWKRIPLKDRRTLLRHWRQRAADPVTGRSIIAAVLVPSWGATDPGTVAQCREYGHKLFFKQEYFELCPEQLFYFIAHELAHATWMARGESAHLEAAAEIRPDLEGHDDAIATTCERLAEELVAKWGVRREWLVQMQTQMESRQNPAHQRGMAQVQGGTNVAQAQPPPAAGTPPERTTGRT